MKIERFGWQIRFEISRFPVWMADAAIQRDGWRADSRAGYPLPSRHRPGGAGVREEAEADVIQTT
jgi:hypothetical protein